MSNLNLLRKAFGSHFVTRSARSNHGLPLFFRQSPRFFSTEGEQPPSQPVADPFLDTSKATGMNLVPTSSLSLGDVLERDFGRGLGFIDFGGLDFLGQFSFQSI